MYAENDEFGFSARGNIQDLVGRHPPFHNVFRHTPKLSLFWDEIAQEPFRGRDQVRRLYKLTRLGFFNHMNQCEVGLVFLSE
jgi:hypothetical protein